MTKVKRIMAVFFLCLVVLLVGYSCYTGSRLTNYPKELDGYQNMIFYAKDGTMLAFTDGYAWYQSEEQQIVLLQIIEYDQGVILMQREDKKFYFTAIDTESVYDEQSNQFLTKGEGYG